MENKPVWKHSNFVKFFSKSPRKAFEYRKQCNGTEIPVEYMTDEEKKAIKSVKTQETAPETIETISQDTTQAEDQSKVTDEVQSETISVEDLTIEDMRVILDSASIKYSHLAKEVGLMKLLKENKLV